MIQINIGRRVTKIDYDVEKAREQIDKFTERAIAEVDKRLKLIGKCEKDSIVGELKLHTQRIAPAACIFCGKNFYAFDQGWYKDFEGRVFCSHKCIDGYKDKNEKK